MAGLVSSGRDYLFLPRPWLKHDLATMSKPSRNRIDALYVRGDVMVDGKTIRLPYWHKVVRVVAVES